MIFPPLRQMMQVDFPAVQKKIKAYVAEFYKASPEVVSAQVADFNVTRGSPLDRIHMMIADDIRAAAFQLEASDRIKKVLRAGVSTSACVPSKPSMSLQTGWEEHDAVHVLADGSIVQQEHIFVPKPTGVAASKRAVQRLDQRLRAAEAAGLVPKCRGMHFCQADIPSAVAVFAPPAEGTKLVKLTDYLRSASAEERAELHAKLWSKFQALIEADGTPISRRTHVNRDRLVVALPAGARTKTNQTKTKTKTKRSPPGVYYFPELSYMSWRDREGDDDDDDVLRDSLDRVFAPDDKPYWVTTDFYGTMCKFVLSKMVRDRVLVVDTASLTRSLSQVQGRRNA